LRNTIAQESVTEGLQANLKVRLFFFEIEQRIPGSNKIFFCCDVKFWDSHSYSPQDGERPRDPDAHCHEWLKPAAEANLRQDETGKHELGEVLALLTRSG